MTEMTLAQKQAIALANARARAAQSAPQSEEERMQAQMQSNFGTSSTGADQAFTPEQISKNKANDEGAFAAFAGNMLPGMTFGAADEIGAGIASLFEDRSYGEILQGLRDQQARQMEQHPIASISGQVLGGAALPGAGGAKFVAGARSLPGMVGRSATLGAGAGATQGFMEGEGGLENRTTGGVIGALLGGAIGGAIPIVGAGGRTLVRGGADMLNKARVGSQIGKELGVSNQAARVLGNVIGSDDPAAMAAALNRAGPGAMLADVSPQATGMLDMAMRSPIPAARTAAQAVEGRASGAYGDVTRAMDASMGGPAGMNAAEGAIRTGSAPARKAAYDAAYAVPIDYSAPAGAKLLDELTPRIPPQAIKYANTLMRNKGEKSPQIMASIADDGTVSFSNPPDVRQWDYIKQGIDMLAETGEGAGALGGQTRLGASYQNLSREVRDAVGEAVPEYNTARAVAADAIDRRNALQFGAEVLRPGTTREQVRDAVARAGVPGATVSDEVMAMRQGIRSQIDETLANVRAVASDQNVDARAASKAFSDLSSPAAREKMALVLGDEWPNLRDQLDQSGAALGLRARTSANSATFGRGAAEGAVMDEITPGALRRGQPINAVKETIAGLLGASPTAIRRMSDDVKGEIAGVLTRQGVDVPQRAVSAIVKALSDNPVNTEAGKGVRRVIEALMLGNTGAVSSGLQSQLMPQLQSR